MLLTYTFFWGHLFWISSIRVLFFGIPGGSLSRSVISKGSVGGEEGGVLFFFSLSLLSKNKPGKKFWKNTLCPGSPLPCMRGQVSFSF